MRRRDQLVLHLVRETAARDDLAEQRGLLRIDLAIGDDTVDMTQVVSAIGLLHVRGPGAILVTSVEVNETPAGHIDVVASDGAAHFPH